MSPFAGDLERAWLDCLLYGRACPEVIIVPGSWMHRVRVHGRVRVRVRGRWVTRPARRWCLRPHVLEQFRPAFGDAPVAVDTALPLGKPRPELTVTRAERHWTTLARDWRGRGRPR